MNDILEKQQAFFRTNKTKDYKFRKEQLLKLRQMIQEHMEEIEEALYLDLHKSPFEAYSTEIGFCLYSITKALKKLKKWMKPKKVATPLHLFMTRSFIQLEPLGSVLIIGPYNYPFQLVIEPLIGVIAAGNTAVIKPSEFASHTEQLLLKLINETFAEDYIHCVSGGKELVQELIHRKFDHIFFTGSTQVGQIVYEAASKNLVPVTLELGGKSPAIVDETVPLDIAAKRIVFGKFINAGQTCIAPDYIYVKEEQKEKLIKHLIHAIETFYPNHEEGYVKIINQKHYNRLSALIDEDKVVYGDKRNGKDLKISPTILDNITWEDPVMQEEIFGPVLPILTYQSLDDVIGLLKNKEKPLALYVFTKDKKAEERIFHDLSFGGGAVNDTIMHIVNARIPFGGVGSSGIGEYHGYSSFERFSNQKGYVKKSLLFDLPIAYPPYKKWKEKLVRLVLK